MARIPRGSLPLRVLGIGFLVFAVPLMVYFVVLYRADYRRDMGRVLLVLQEIAQGRAKLFEAADANAFQALSIIETLNKEGVGTLDAILTGVTEGGDFVRAFYIEIGEGGYTATASSDPAMKGEDFSGYFPLQLALEKGELSVLGLSNERFEKLLYAVRVIEGLKGPEGFLVVAQDITSILASILASPELGYPVHCSILTQGGLVYASGDPDLTLQVIDADDPGIRLMLEPIEGVKGGYYLEWEGRDRIAIEAPIGDTGFTLIVDADRGAVFAYQTKRLLHAVVIFFALFAVGGALALYLTQKMAIPLGHLREVMHTVSLGDLSPRFQPKPMGFEINQIGLIFNEMVESLSQNMARASGERVQREILQKELDIGQEIQRSILPHTKPTFPGLDIGARYLPSKQVGGDFYDVFVKRANGNDVVLTIADASGKGISACLYALLIRSMLRSYTARESELPDIVREANNVFCEDTGDTGMFVTAFSALYRSKDRRLTYTSQGHNPAYLRRQDGRIEELQGRGIALGIQRLDAVEADEVQLESGDILLMYTDGVTEAHNEKLELFGEERLIDYLKREHPADGEQIADGLVSEVERFCGGHPQHDDITIMVVRVL